MDYVPTKPVRPTLAFSLDLLQLFHEIFMEGPIAKRAFATRLKLFLERNFQIDQPSLIKPMYEAYAQWQITTKQTLRTKLSTMHDITGESWSPGEYTNICPACFYPVEPDNLATPLICAIDGVFPHRRLKLNDDHEESFEDIRTFLFTEHNM